MYDCKWKKDLLPLLNGHLKSMLEQVMPEEGLEEIRIRAGMPIQMRFSASERMLYAPGGRPAVTAEECQALLSSLCEHSLYAWEDEIRNGFITLPGGYRVGFGGRAVMYNGVYDHMGNVTSVCIRIARACTGCADALMKHIGSGSQIDSVLLIGAPGCGKTTMLRDIVRQLSQRKNISVTVIDERMEISASVQGIPEFDMGIRTDILSGCHKAQGIRMAIRTLAPTVLVTDELGTLEEAAAVLDAKNAGVAVIASAHAETLRSLFLREAFSLLNEECAFHRYILLGRSHGPGTVEGIFEGSAKGKRDAS